jgi:transposase
MAPRPSTRTMLRGYKFRIYPTAEQVTELRRIQELQRLIWNWNARESNTVYRVREAWAVRYGHAAPFVDWRSFAAERGAPDMYPKDGTAEQQAAWRQCRRDWESYCVERRKKIDAAAKDQPALAYRSLKDWCQHLGVKQPYQLFGRVLAWHGYEAHGLHAHTLQALEKTIYSKGTKRIRKRAADMPIRTRSGDCLELGSFGLRRGAPFYNARVSINGMKILGRSHRDLSGLQVMQGVAIREEADGWYASVRVHFPERALPEPVRGTAVGIDVGLVYLAAVVDTVDARDPSGLALRLENPRGAEFAERVAGRRALDKPTARIEQRGARQSRELCYRLARDLELHEFEFVFVEALPADIGQRGDSRLSCMRMLVEILKDKLGDRVREVRPEYTSQECSQCGHRSKESWSCGGSRIGKCPRCGHSEDRDINAARNILRKGLESLVAEAV